MSTMLADVRSVALSGAQIEGACAKGFLEEAVKLDLTSLLVVTTFVVAVMALARVINLHCGGM